MSTDARWQFFSVVLALAVIAVGLRYDTAFADMIYNVSVGGWPIDHHAGWLRTLFYSGPKKLIALIGLSTLTCLLVPALRPKRWLTKKETQFLFACFAAVPLFVWIVKTNSSVSCPASLMRYGGPNANLLGHPSFAGLFDSARSGGCWPSGHVSGAFSLLAVCFLPRTLIARALAGSAIMLLASGMAFYQLFRGAHFPSHIVLSLCLALFVIALLRQAFGLAKIPIAHPQRAAAGTNSHPSSLVLAYRR